MRELSLWPPAFSVSGAVDVQPLNPGLDFRRLPGWALAQTPDPVLHLMSRMSAGVRLSLVSDTERLELDVEATGVCYAGGLRRRVTFDLYVDGVLHQRHNLGAGPTDYIDYQQTPPEVIARPGIVETLLFEGLPGKGAHIELWLPQAASVHVKAVRVEAGARVEPASDRRPVWAHYGSSISHGMDADGPSETWLAVAARSLDLSLISLGFAAQCQMDGFVARLLSRMPCDLISLKLGVNLVNQDVMRERAFIPAAHAFLDRIRDARPEVPILVISPLLCPMHEECPGPTLRDPPGYRAITRPAELASGALTVSRIRALLQLIVNARREAGDHNLHYLDGLRLLGAADAGALHDGLHPDAGGQRQVGQRFVDWVIGPAGWLPEPLKSDAQVREYLQRGPASPEPPGVPASR